MVSRPAKKQPDIARLITDLRAAKVELLSAECAVDRLRLQHSIEDIVSFGERQALERAIASIHALSFFVSQVEAQIKVQDDAKN